MKKFARILLLLVAILAILLVGGHIFLTKHLTAIVRNNAQPAVEENLGVSFDLKNAAVNLLTGTLSVSDVQLGNPQGFTEPALARIDTIRLAITLSELLRGGIVDLGEVTVKGAELTIENTPGAGINLQTVLKTLNDRAAQTESTPPPPSPDTTPSGDSTPESTNPALPRARIRDASLDLTVRYVDSSPHKPYEFSLNETLTVSDLTIGMSAPHPAEFQIVGTLKGNKRAAVTTIQGKLAPIEDPRRITFSLDGDIANVTPELIQRFLGKHDITADGLSLQIALECRDGRFSKRNSTIALVLTNMTLPPNLGRKMPGKIATFPKISVPLSISGTLQEPEIEGLLPAILSAAVTNLKDNPALTGAIIDSIGDALKKHTRKRDD